MLTITSNVSPSFCESFCSLVSSSPFEFITMLIAVISAILAFLAYKHQRNQAKKAESCRLAKWYAEKLIPRSTYISSVLIDAHYTDLAAKIFPIDTISDFTKTEMMGLLNQTHIESPDSIIEKALVVDPHMIFKNKLIYARSDTERDECIKSYIADNKPDGSSTLQNVSFLQGDFVRYIGDFLNDLEWFAMECQYHIADEELLYQSLHQTFLSDMQMLYVHIASRNDGSGEDKFFTNIIWLFTIWKRRLEKYKSKNNKKIQHAKRKAEIAVKKAETAGNITHHGKSM